MNNIIKQSNPLNILVIDDDEDIVKLVGRAAGDLACNCLTITDSFLAVRAYTRFKPDIIFLDLCMPKLDGIEVMHALAEQDCKSQLVLMTGLKDRLLKASLEVAKSQNLAILESIKKPFGKSDIADILNKEIAARTSRLSLSEEESDDLPASDNSLPGPVLQYENITFLQESSRSQLQTYRLSFRWRTDNGHEISFKQLLRDEQKPEAISGITHLMMSKLHIDLCSLPEISKSDCHFYITASPELLLQPHKVSELMNIVEANHLLPSMFTLEVDEDSLLMNPDCVRETMTSLELHGFRTALICAQDSDNVLSRIRHLPVDEVQIDLSANKLLSERTQSTEADFWLGSLVSFARREQLAVNVRNISSEAQWQLAKSCQVECASGRLFGEPRSQLTQESATAVANSG